MINSASFLHKILTDKRKKIKSLINKDPELKGIKKKAEEVGLSSYNFYNALQASPFLSVIAEVKRASPSRGIMQPNLDPIMQSISYQDHGASAISVITEENFFKGSLEDLQKVRNACSLPILLKDFIVHEYQIYEAYTLGADAVLLITAALSERELCNFVDLAFKIGVEPVVEVHDINELPIALKTKTRIIGINNRDLVTFRVDINTTSSLAPLISKDRLIISESGIRNTQDAQNVANYGARAILVGEALVTSQDIGSILTPLTKIKCALG